MPFEWLTSPNEEIAIYDTFQPTDMHRGLTTLRMCAIAAARTVSGRPPLRGRFLIESVVKDFRVTAYGLAE